jgi:hypothetical protein
MTIGVVLKPMSLDQRAERIRGLVNSLRTSVIEVGRELVAAKAQCPHGTWLPWLEENFGWMEMTATRYMRVAQTFKSFKSNSVLTIDSSALYLLAGPRVPQTIRDEATERAAQGEKITRKKVQEMIVEHVKVHKPVEAVGEVLQEEFESFEDKIFRDIIRLFKNKRFDRSARNITRAKKLKSLLEEYLGGN